MKLILLACFLIAITLSDTIAPAGGNYINGSYNALVNAQGNLILGDYNSLGNANSNVVVGGGNTLLNTGSNLILGQNNLVAGLPPVPINNCLVFNLNINSGRLLPRKVAIRSLVNGKFVCAENAGQSSLIANRDKIGPWETFDLFDVAPNSISLRSITNGKYVTAPQNCSVPLIATQDSLSPQEIFIV